MEEEREQTKWEALELYLFDGDRQGSDFSAVEYAEDAEIEVAEASSAIQSHLRAQRGEKSRTLFVLRRVPGTRTTSARWAVGVRTTDARAITRTLTDDIKMTIRRSVEPDLRRIAELNPRAARVAAALIDAYADSLVKFLDAAAAED